MFLIMNWLVLQFVLNMEKGVPLLPKWLSFSRVNARAWTGVEIGPARLHLRYEISFPMALLFNLLHKHSESRVCVLEN